MHEHDRAQELLVSYVLGELGPEEESKLRGHLEGCPECRAELEEFQQAHGRLKAAHVPPPAELKQRVMGRLPGRRRSRGRFVPAVAAALALVALLGGLSLSTILAPREYAVASLGPTALAPEAGGEARLREAGANVQVRLEVWGLPQQRPDGYYELWFVKGDDRVSAGSFTVGPDGKATVEASVPAKLAEEYRGLGITSEKSPGDPRPSPSKVLGGELGEPRASVRAVAANT